MEKKKVSKNPKKTTKINNKKITTKQKKTKRGFTLIELLAVIIILGILMIIAIPSVTRYINDSRKSAYVDTAKEIVSGTRNIVNEGKLGMYDTAITYYIPAKYINTENSLKSPYGEFTDTSAYVGVIYDGTGYKYYWISSDDAGQGVPDITPADKLDTDDIKSDLNPNDILDKIKKTGIGDRTSIKILKMDGLWDDFVADDNVGEDGESQSNGYTGYAYVYTPRGSAYIGDKLENRRETIWCPVDTVYEEINCVFDPAPSTEAECLERIQGYDNYTCVSRDRLFDENHISYYELNKISFYGKYYIKMHMKNDVIDKAWVCFDIDNHEYCIEGGDNGASYTQNVSVLQSVQSNFGDCSFGEHEANCYQGNSNSLKYITTDDAGNVTIGNNWGAQCFINATYDYFACPD